MLQILKLISKYIQTPQSLKEAPETSLTFLEKETVEKRILEIYKEYQSFMSVNDMPRYKIHFKKKSVETLELASVEYEDEIYHLYISDVAYNSINIKGILFHEFTHIYDREYLYNKYRFSKDGNLSNIHTHTFTEIHAEQIKFLFMLGLKDINDIQTNISHNTIVYDMDNKESEFYDYLKNFNCMLKDFYFKRIKTINKAYQKTTKDKIGSMVDKLLYYIGALSVYGKYCDYKIDELKDLTVIQDTWKVSLNEVIDFYCNNDIYNLKKKDIINTSEIMMCDFVRGAKELQIL